MLEISIHALREEGDPGRCPDFVALANISIHALREEGDRGWSWKHMDTAKFLSTPSARRATSIPGVLDNL